MIIEPKVKGFICITAHPEGCKENVRQQIEYVKKAKKVEGPKNVLVIGSSTGYGLASRIDAAFGFKAATLGVMFERPGKGKRTATPGWYNTQAFEQFATKQGLYAKTINGDAFSKEVKEQVLNTIRLDMGKIDLVIYSLAAPKRTTNDGVTYQSVLKTTGDPFTDKSWNMKDNTITKVTIPPATAEEIEDTVKVMGGEDWMDWIAALYEADLMSENAITMAYSYIGPKITYPIYYQGTIGMAKKHLLDCSNKMNVLYRDKGLQSYVSVNKALVTQASSAIPIVPLYFSILYKVMKAHNLHEGCIEQITRLLHEKIYTNQLDLDEAGRIRMDDYEMKEEIQKEVFDIWYKITDDTILDMADIKGYWEDFYHMFGFHFDTVDYTKDIEL